MKAAAVFSDNMVLQRGKNVRIFGECDDSSAKIDVSVPELGKTAQAVVSGNKWEAVLPPMEACAECTVEICSDSEKITFSNVAVGEVWLAGGQSNMEFELQNDFSGTEELSACSGENVRFYYTPKCASADDELIKAEESACWTLPDKKSASAWSAVGYYFAKELSRKLGVTVGIIGCNWGGTSASAWMKRAYLEHDKALRIYLDEYEKATEGKTEEQMIAEYAEYTEYHEKWQQRVNRCYEEEPDIKWAKVLEKCGENRYPGPPGCKNPMRPCGLYETMISRVCPYTVKGFIYYQGESDDHRPDSYYRLLSALIENWRNDWQDDELPFLFVQLPMFRNADDEDTKNWAEIREAQEKVYKTVRRTGLAVALDCGEFNNIHPIRKAPVGHRLFLQAMYEVYRGISDSEANPPVYRDYEVNGDSITLYFSNCSGFEVCGALAGFEAAGADGVYYPADAVISGETIILRSDKVSRPVSARMQWTNYADVTLFGRNGIPVPPFRTRKY